jgi:hypothetical protein
MMKIIIKGSMHNMKINQKTKWGEVDKDLEFLDHPAFPKPDVYKTRQKPRVAVMGYRKDDIPGGDIQPSYNVKKDKWEPKGAVQEDHIGSSNRTLVYWKDAFENKVREIVRLESKLAYKDQQIEDLREQLKEFYNE